MNIGISPDFLEYLESVARGEHVLYHAGMDMLTVFSSPRDPILTDEPYPFAMAALFDPWAEDRPYANTVGYCFYSMRSFFRVARGVQLLPYFNAAAIDARMFIAVFEEELLTWSGWQLEHNDAFKETRLQHEPGQSNKSLQAALDVYKRKNEEIIQSIWEALQKGTMPSKLPTTVFQKILLPHPHDRTRTQDGLPV